ncbi:uncharacterized protein LOC144704640 [Wolffia australiana]
MYAAPPPAILAAQPPAPEMYAAPPPAILAAQPPAISERRRSKVSLLLVASSPHRRSPPARRRRLAGRPLVARQWPIDRALVSPSTLLCCCPPPTFSRCGGNRPRALPAASPANIRRSTSGSLAGRPTVHRRPSSGPPSSCPAALTALRRPSDRPTALWPSSCSPTALPPSSRPPAVHPCRPSCRPPCRSHRLPCRPPFPATLPAAIGRPCAAPPTALPPLPPAPPPLPPAPPPLPPLSAAVALPCRCPEPVRQNAQGGLRLLDCRRAQNLFDEMPERDFVSWTAAAPRTCSTKCPKGTSSELCCLKGSFLRRRRSLRVGSPWRLSAALSASAGTSASTALDGLRRPWRLPAALCESSLAISCVRSASLGRSLSHGTPRLLPPPLAPTAASGASSRLGCPRASSDLFWPSPAFSGRLLPP